MKHLSFLALACSLAAPAAMAQAPAKALQAISGESFVANIKTLASDDFEGRGPGTAGDAKTTAFLQREFAKLGLKPGNPNGSYFQEVPVVAMKAAPQLSYQVGAKTIKLNFPDDFVAHSSRP
jgi:hypothetical protein